MGRECGTRARRGEERQGHGRPRRRPPAVVRRVISLSLARRAPFCAGLPFPRAAAPNARAPSAAPLRLAAHPRPPSQRLGDADEWPAVRNSVLMVLLGAVAAYAHYRANSPGSLDDWARDEA